MNGLYENLNIDHSNQILKGSKLENHSELKAIIVVKLGAGPPSLLENRAKRWRPATGGWRR
jgi:hypothetical protein